VHSVGSFFFVFLEFPPPVSPTAPIVLPRATSSSSSASTPTTASSLVRTPSTATTTTATSSITSRGGGTTTPATTPSANLGTSAGLDFPDGSLDDAYDEDADRQRLIAEQQRWEGGGEDDDEEQDEEAFPSFAAFFSHHFQMCVYTLLLRDAGGCAWL
jgi:hypothetical protein